MNADGGQQKYLFGYRAEQSVGSHINKATQTFASAEMVDPLPDDPESALIRVRNWSTGLEGADRLVRLNVYTGATSQRGSPPATGQTEYVTDSQGRARYALVRDTQNRLRAFQRASEKDEWIEESREAGSDTRFTPWGFGADPDLLYLYVDRPDGTCLVERTLSKATDRSLGCDLNYAPASFDGQRPIGLVRNSGKPELRLFKGDPEADLWKSLASSFPGEFVQRLSGTRDGNLALLLVYSDRNPGDYYLFDRRSKKARYLFSARGWIDPAQMAERRPLSFPARDGLPLTAYLTLPPGREAKNLPLVVNPHGGPFGLRDEWEWDAEAQLLASRGYAVLQVNFRGSGGRGMNFRDAGKREWGGKMIDDITDGLAHVVEKGYADPQRVCLYGGSYGGYASLMSAVREPQRYRCAVTYVGVSDLPAWASDTDVDNYLGGQAYIRDYIGGPEVLARHSPLAYLQNLTAPLFIVHGEADKRVPFSQAKRLRKALDERKHPYEWLTKPTEGHGFFLQKNREEFYTRLLAFVGQHTAKSAP